MKSASIGPDFINQLIKLLSVAVQRNYDTILYIVGPSANLKNLSNYAGPLAKDDNEVMTFCNLNDKVIQNFIHVIVSNYLFWKYNKKSNSFTEMIEAIAPSDIDPVFREYADDMKHRDNCRISVIEPEFHKNIHNDDYALVLQVVCKMLAENYNKKEGASKAAHPQPNILWIISRFVNEAESVGFDRKIAMKVMKKTYDASSVVKKPKAIKKAPKEKPVEDSESDDYVDSEPISP